LVAILEGTYQRMQEQGNFSFQCNQYEFIERYSIAFKDDWGYSELVLHPAPLNVFTLILVPAVFKRSAMRTFAEVFGKFVFWFENMFALINFLIYELVLMILVYFKQTYTVVVQVSGWNRVWLFVFWTLFGLFCLFICLIQDIILLFKLLCDPKDEDDIIGEKRREDAK
jgi:hypothetical protein